MVPCAYVRLCPVWNVKCYRVRGNKQLMILLCLGATDSIEYAMRTEYAHWHWLNGHRQSTVIIMIIGSDDDDSEEIFIFTHLKRTELMAFNFSGISIEAFSLLRKQIKLFLCSLMGKTKFHAEWRFGSTWKGNTKIGIAKLTVIR